MKMIQRNWGCPAGIQLIPTNPFNKRFYYLNFIWFSYATWLAITASASVLELGFSVMEKPDRFRRTMGGFTYVSISLKLAQLIDVELSVPVWYRKEVAWLEYIGEENDKD